MKNITNHIANILAIILAFLAPIAPLILTVGLFILADTIVGIWKAKKINDKITSRKLSAIISKMVLYQSALIMFYLIDTFILQDFIKGFLQIPFFLTKIVAATLVFIELKSIDESTTIIFGFSFWDKFKDLLSRSKSLKKEFKDF